MESELHSLEARKSPEWLTRSAMYQIFLRTFTPEGTLKAATKRLPELKRLGVDILYLCPVNLHDDDPRREFWSPRQKAYADAMRPNAKNPYRIKDFYAIEPEYGTADDLRVFVAEAHGLGFRVILDVVFLHCGPAAVFIEKRPDFVKRNPDGSIALASWGFPALNFESRELREDLWRNLEFFVNDFDVDGFRCDVSDGVPLDFWETARERLSKLRDDLIILAEGERKEDQLKAFDLNYNFTFAYAAHRHFYRGTSASKLREILERMAAERPKGARFIRYSDNHDLAHDSAQGFMPSPSQTKEEWLKKAEARGVPDSGLPPGSRHEVKWGRPACDAMLALCFALDGVPFLYNGQEVADSAPHSIFDTVPVDWKNGETPEGEARFALCQKLCSLRHSEKALAEGSVDWLENAAPDAVLSFLRRFEGEEILFVANLSKNALRPGLALPAGTAFKKLLASSGGSFDELEPYGFFIGKRS